MTQVALPGLVLTMAASALAATTVGSPDHGVVGNTSGGRLTSVTPGSPTWRDGIRPPQRVLALDDAATPAGWRIKTTDGHVIRESFGASHLEVLRLHVLWAVPALALAALAALLTYRSHRAAAPLLPVALAIAAQPLFAVGRADVTIAGGVAVFVGGGLSVATFAPRDPRALVGIAVGILLAAAWTLATVTGLAIFDTIDALRGPAAVGFAVLGLVIATDRRRLAEFLTNRQGASFIDLSYLAGAVGLVVALATIVGVPIPLLLVASAAGLVIYPFWRRHTLGTLERLLTAPARQEAAIRAIENERGRLAREIHDAPLQELTGVIRRLESVPGAEVEASALRDVAAQLRDVATALHPPVLQDLGLPAALADLADQLGGSRPDWLIKVSVDDLTGGERPPQDVELAAFRVIQEATANALAHSVGRTMVIEGAVSGDTVELKTADDGAGIDLSSARNARRNGHFGLGSIRERAQAVGAESVVTSNPNGVTVTFRWERSG